MSQTKAQLIQPIGIVTAGGVVVTGVVTASSFDGDVVGTATSIISGGNLNLGDVNATTFSGDFTGNATGINTGADIKVGSFTATSFTGDFTGTATSMMRGTGFEAGTVTATPANVTYAVTVGSKTGGGNAFYLDGIEAPVPSLYPGATYTFDQSDSTNGDHPLRFATAADAAGSTEYSVGVTVNGTQGTAGAYTRIVVSPSAPDTLYYYCTAHSGMGDSINITNLLQGAVTGNVTGDVKGNISGNMIGNVTGDVTGNVTGDVTGVSTGNVTGNVTGNLTGNVVGTAVSVASGANIHVGVMTATSYHGDGSGMTGIAASSFTSQTVTANSSETIIDLSNGNVVTMNQSSDTTVGFASTGTSALVTVFRNKDDNDTPRSITWPSNVNWHGNVAPVLIANATSKDVQQFEFLTRDGGLTWYAWEPVNYDVKSYNIWSWGTNDNGALGQNSTSGLEKASSPLQIGNNDNWINIHSTGAGAFAVTADGKLFAWGRNQEGQLGQNNKTDRSSPKQISGTNWSPNISSTMQSVIAVKNDGTLWVWGDNAKGSLGLNQAGWPTRTHQSSPTQLPGTTWSTREGQVFCGPAGMLAIKTDGSLWSWGANVRGWLGLNTGAPSGEDRSSPCRIGTDTDWKRVSGCAGGQGGAFALKNDGSLWSWGYNNDGGLGHQNKTSYSSPNQVGKDTNWLDIGGGSTMNNCSAVKTDGTLWSWGYNNTGELGHNNRSEYTSPRQVGTKTWWARTGGLGGYASAHLDRAGGIWTAGWNQTGSLGNNQPDSIRKSSPVQVPGSFVEVSMTSGSLQALANYRGV